MIGYLMFIVMLIRKCRMNSVVVELILYCVREVRMNRLGLMKNSLWWFRWLVS